MFTYRQTKALLYFLILLGFTFLPVTGQYEYRVTKNGIELQGVESKSHSADFIRISVVQDNIIHVEAGKKEQASKLVSLIVEPHSLQTGVDWEISKRKGVLTLTTEKAGVKIWLKSGKVSFFDQAEGMILEEEVREIVPAIVGGEDTYHIKQGFVWTKDEAIFGLGQHQEGHMNYRGKKVILEQENTVVAIPFLISTQGYGILWDNYSETHFSDNEEGSYLWSRVGDQIDYYYIYGPEFDDIISGFRSLSGEAPMFPKWSLGYIQSRCRIPSQKELLSVAERYRALKIPVDVLVISYRHWGKHGMGSLKFDEDFWPAPAEMVEELHQKYNLHTIISTWPSFEPKTSNWALMKEKDYLLGFQNYFMAEVYDPYIPEAGDLYWRLLGNSLFGLGIDGWWLDCSEPEYPGKYRKTNNYLGTGERYLNTYSLYATKNIYEGQRMQDNQKRVFTITRSSFPGQQKYGAATWSGDVGISLKLEVGSDFNTLKAQVPAGLNFCMSGIPYWTTDIGGYKGGLPSNPEYQEIFVRWFQYGTFCPIFRTHGERYPGCVASPRNDSITSNELWAYGDDAMNICKAFIELRYRLMPYIYSLSWQVTDQAYTLMRALPFDYRQDNAVHEIDDQFMFGPSLLVNPVLTAGAESREVYLPGEEIWYDFWTQEILKGGQRITAKAPIESMPLYVKAGSILPMGPNIQYATEKTDPIELRIYKGADGEFLLYEDENDTYNYENGYYSIIPITYKEKSHQLTIGKRQGGFRGMLLEREFHVVFMDGAGKGGAEVIKVPDHIIRYDGNEVVVYD